MKIKVLQLIAITLSISFSVLAEPDFSQIGFSTLPGLGVETTTGGGNAAPVFVKTADEFRTQVERRDIKKKEDRGNAPRVIVVAEDIDLGELKNGKPGDEIKDIGIVYPESNTTIYSLGEGKTIRRGTISIHGRSNIIIRNLKFRDLWEFDPTGEYDKNGWDYLVVTEQNNTFSHHIWIDHCDFGKVYDGQLDVVHGSDFVTISWCKFAGDEKGPQKKVTLIGHGPNNAEEDAGRLNVTLHHNWYENIEDRAPRARFGNIHTFNNYINGATFGSLAVCNAAMLIEANHYNDVAIATTFSHAKDTIENKKGGTIAIADSLNTNPRAFEAKSDVEKFEFENNFKGSVAREAMTFNKTLNINWADPKKLPYAYKLDQAAEVAEIVKKYAGAGKIDPSK